MSDQTSKGTFSKFWKRIGYGRILTQITFLALTLWIAIQMLRGVRGATIEKYCPFGGAETLIPWINKTGTLCSLSTINISILVGVVLITLLFKRVFCSHICPMGTVLEWIGNFGRKFVIGSRRIPPKADKALKWLKYPLLILIIALTVKFGELIFRNFDPYYVLFTAGKGHEITAIGIWVTLGILVAGALIPLSFCKYLCPMAACLAPFGRLGLVRVSRDEDKCTQCGACDKACEWGIPVSQVKAVVSAECSNCQECIRKCPVENTLSLGVGKAKT